MAFTQQTFMGASIRTFDANIGWGTQSTTLRVGLVEDPDNGDNFDPVDIGLPVRFTYENWSMDGILQNIRNKNSDTGKNIIEVTISDPRQILEGVQMILANYAGTIDGVPNLYNVYGYLENEKGFGGSFINNAGMSWSTIKQTITQLASDTPIKFRGSSYFVDLSLLPPIPSTYRIGGSNIDLLSFIQNVCETGGCDYFVELIGNIIKVRTVNKGTQPSFGRIAQFISQTDGSSANSTGFDLEYNITSKFVVGGNVERVYLQDSNIIPFWGYQWEDPMNRINPRPVIGQGEGNNHRFLLDGTAITYPGLTDFRSGYPCDVGELRAALIDQEAWEAYLLANDLEDNIHHNKVEKIGIQSNFKHSINVMLGGDPDDDSDPINLLDITEFIPKDFANLSKNQKNRINNELNNDKWQIPTRVYEFVKRFASENFGRKYMVPIPFVFVKKEPESNTIKTSLEPTDSGFVEESLFPNLVARNLAPLDINFVTDSKNKIVAYVRFDANQEIIDEEGNRSDSLDVSLLGEEDYVISGNSVFVKCIIDPQKVIYLRPENATGPRVIITLPAPVLSTHNTENPMGNLLNLFIKKAEENDTDNPEVLAKRVFSKVGGESIFTGETSMPLTPVIAAIPLRDNTKTYGPWKSVGAEGKVDFEQNNDMVPWNFGNFEAMNKAGNAIVEEALVNRQVSEGGSVEFPGAPAINLGRNLISGGPHISDINVSVNPQGGVTTNYRCNSWDVPGVGRISRSNIERMQKISKVAQEQKRAFRSLFHERKPFSHENLNGEQKTVLRQFPARLRRTTSSHMLMGEMVPQASGDKVITNVASSPFYNLLTVLDNATTSGVPSNYPNLAGTSMDGMFRPFSTDSDASGIPHYETPSGSTSDIDSDSLDPYQTGHDVGVVIRGDERPDNLNIDTFGDGGPSDVYRPLGLRAPLVMVGWGYDTNGKPVPNKTPDDPGDDFLDNHLQRSDKWKVGPLDSRWDNNRKVWVAGGTGVNSVSFEVVESTLASGEVKANVLSRPVGLSEVPLESGGKINVHDTIGCFLTYYNDSDLVGTKGYAQYMDDGSSEKWEITYLCPNYTDKDIVVNTVWDSSGLHQTKINVPVLASGNEFTSTIAGRKEDC